MSDLVAVLSILVISLVAHRCYPLASIAYSRRLCCLRYGVIPSCETVHKDLSSIATLFLSCRSDSPSAHSTGDRFLQMLMEVAKKNVVQKSGEEDVYVGTSTAEASAVLIYERYHTRLAVRKYLV
jgi:hypothetical protein